MDAKHRYMTGALAGVTTAIAALGGAAAEESKITTRKFGDWTLLCKDPIVNGKLADCGLTAGIIDSESRETLRLVFLLNAQDPSKGGLVFKTSRDHLNKWGVRPSIFLHYPEEADRFLRVHVAEDACEAGKGCSFAIDLSAQGLQSFFTSAAMTIEIPESDKHGTRYEIPMEGFAEAMKAMDYREPAAQP